MPDSNHTARITHHASRITHHASRITHHASRITHHASRITHHASRITHHASRITHHASRRSPAPPENKQGKHHMQSSLPQRHASHAQRPALRRAPSAPRAPPPRTLPIRPNPPSLGDCLIAPRNRIPNALAVAIAAAAGRCGKPRGSVSAVCVRTYVTVSTGVLQSAFETRGCTARMFPRGGGDARLAVSWHEAWGGVLVLRCLAGGPAFSCADARTLWSEGRRVLSGVARRGGEGCAAARARLGGVVRRRQAGLLGLGLRRAAVRGHVCWLWCCWRRPA
ncbi:hypothetical protein C7974DRAFT_50794 [Boeremia exigua]|uniref:uncharacterized protein n=1 Tax=Boeremia exigua TaxID=749465 RepID=UPI001E8EE0D8|nr:uncharacterized protein C7974DRAFT_50794 [Boeremia exigua]KAH6616714.1 hypothetical protein C7974DRAFT_50794 [Boeremia exigua]